MTLIRPKISKTKKVRVPIQVPINIDEATNFIGEIGDLERLIKDESGELERQVTALRIATAARVEPMKAQVLAIVNGLFAYATRNRDVLTAGGKKTVELPTGTFRWRLTPPSVSIDDSEAVIARIKKLGLDAQFLRVREDVDKDAMLKDPEKARSIEGVLIGGQEEFVVKPLTFDTEIVKKVRKKTAKKGGKKPLK